MALLTDVGGSARPIRVLMLTSEYPTPSRPGGGAFVVRQIRALREAGIEVDVLDFVSRANPINHFRAWQRMRLMMREKRYDVIHAQFAITTLVSRLQLSLPIVATYHGDETYGIIAPDGRRTLKGVALILASQALAFLVDEIIVVSLAMGTRLFRKDWHIVPSGIELEKFKPIPRDEARAKLGWHTESRIALCALLNVNEPRKRFWLANAAVEIACKTLPIEIRVATNIGPDEMPLYMNASDVLLLTSLHEGSPTVVKEALACNLPIVTVNVGDVEERLKGVSHSCVVNATPEDIAQGILEVVRTPVRSNGRETVLELSEALLAQKVIGIYQRAIRRRSRLRRWPTLT